MSKRIDNDGGAYHFFHREAKVYQPVEQEVKERQFISHNKVENNKQGLALGDGVYLHTGEVEENEVEGLDPELEEHRSAKIRGKSRMETAQAVEPLDAYLDRLDENIISAQPHFDFKTKKAELILHYANGKSKVVRKSCYEIAAWLMNESAKGVID